MSDPDFACARLRSWCLLGLALLLTAIIYWPGLSGGWLFDDYPNIVDNHGVQPADASLSSLARAALSSPSSEFKRPLASLSFAANYLVSGLDPYWMKLTNLAIHLLNGLLVFLLTRQLLGSLRSSAEAADTSVENGPAPGAHHGREGLLAALIAAAWMILPINLTGVLYVVQRMESMANVFVLLGLLGYVVGRQRMLTGGRGLPLCALSLVAPTAFGMLAKETSVMLPLYAFLVEWIVFGFRRATASPDRNPRVLALFTLTLLLPMLAGLALIVPAALSPAAFSTRDFTLGQRLLSEARIVADYIGWTLLPTPAALSFYHDDFRISTGLLSPWTTLAGLLVLAALAWLVFALRHRRPLVSLGLAFFLGSHLLTGTVLPLELIYEHRNYFASLGLLLAVVPLLTAPRHADEPPAAAHRRPLPLALPRYVALAGLMLFWTASTALTAYAWGDPLRLANELAGRAPNSPRAQYELGRTYIIYSHYDPASPFTRLAYGPLEDAAALPNSSILPEQALIFMNARMGLPIKAAWWNSMIAKLKAHRPGVQDESSLGALTQCVREARCDLPKQHMTEAFLAALSHPHPSARLLATYGDYAWNVLDEHAMGLQMLSDATTSAPSEPAYHITLARMLAAQGRYAEVEKQIATLRSLNIGGRLERDIAGMRALMPTESSR
jgi:protein O-mannosyl-transferase